MVCSQWYYPDRPSVRPRLDTCPRAFGCGIEPVVLVALAAKLPALTPTCCPTALLWFGKTIFVCGRTPGRARFLVQQVQVEWNEPREQSVQRRDVIAACAAERRGIALIFLYV